MLPLLKYPGGKRRIAAQIQARIGEISERGRLVELFAGSAAVFFHLEPRRALLNDLCEPIIEFYRAIKTAPDAVFEALNELLVLPLGEASYNAVRAEWNSRLPEAAIKSAAQLLYMNKLGFNGLFRLNKSLGYNVAFGKKTKMPAFPGLADFRTVSRVFKDTELKSGDYAQVIEEITPADVVYSDSPYWQTYDRYAGVGFSEANHHELASSLRTLAERGTRVVVSNIDCPEIRGLYQDWCDIDIVPLKHKISCTTDGRKVRHEVLMVSK